ncbi:MAG: ATP-binding protein [Actinomycetota bacterium]
MEASAVLTKKAVSKRRHMTFTGPQRVWLMTVTTALFGGALYATTIHGIEPPFAAQRLPWWLLVGLFYVVEIFVVHLQFKRDAYSFSLSEIPLVLGLFFVGPMGTIAAHMVGAGAALVFHRRQSALKGTFNIVAFGLEAIIASSVFYAIVPADAGIGPAAWGASFAAMGAWGLTQYVLIGLAISLLEGRLQVNTLLQGIGLGMTVTLTNTFVALVGVILLSHDLMTGLLLIVPMATMYFAYRAYTSERSKHESIESLYEATRSAHRSLKVEEAMHNLLSQTLTMFHAERAMITLFPQKEGDPHRRTILEANGDFTYMSPMRLDPTEGVWARVAAEDRAVLVAKPIQNSRIKNFYDNQGIRDTIVAPLHADEAVIGVMHVCNRLGEVATFQDEDAKVLETLANHASISLENARLVARLEESLAHLTEINQLKDDFVASVSHELRTPLTSIQGYVKTLLRPDAQFHPDDVRSFLETVDRQGHRLHRLIEDLLAVSRIESEGPEVAIEPVRIAMVIEDIRDELRSRLEGRHLEIVMAEDLESFETDIGKVHQILSNLVDNAIKYSPEGSSIHIEARGEGSGVLIAVTDEGDGIPFEQQDRIFDRFYQVDQSSTRSVGGAGLGLYLCRKLAEAIGGRLWLEVSGPQGSRFCVWLPDIPPTPARAFPDARRELVRLTSDS